MNQHADDLDNAIDELGRQLDHLRQVGIRGFIAEHTNDDDYAQADTEVGGHGSTSRHGGPCDTSRHQEEGVSQEVNEEEAMRGSVIKRGGSWSVVIDIGRDETGKRIRKWHSGFESKKEAERACVDLLSRFDRGTYISPTKSTLGSFLVDEWLPAKRSTVKATTFASYKMHVDKTHQAAHRLDPFARVDRWSPQLVLRRAADRRASHQRTRVCRRRVCGGFMRPFTRHSPTRFAGVAWLVTLPTKLTRRGRTRPR